MAKLIMLSGLPASGKSTRAKEIISQGNWIRVNRDLLRTMLHCDVWSGRHEGQTVAMEKDIVRNALKGDISVVVDDTNLNPKNKIMWETIAKECDAKFEHIKIDTDWQTCVARDEKREKQVGSVVIKNMAIQSGIITFGEKKIVLCDIDGTVADGTHREHFLQGEKKDWKGYFSKMADDSVCNDVRKMLIEYFNQGYGIIFVSARPEDYRDVTLEWLSKHVMSFAFTILMRRSGDTRPDTEVKKQILDTYFPDKNVIKLVIDDRPAVIRMWRENGLEVVDVGKGVEF